MPIPKLVITAAMMAAQMAMTMTRKIEGPRLDDTKFTGGDYGAPLPFVWGTRRLQVPIFWAENLTEVQRRRKTKGGKFNEYTYYGTFAVALAGHEIEGVRRIWFDTHLVYDLSGAGPVAPFDFGATVGSVSDYVTIYTGTETQTPDPRIQATEGEANTPAYRGTAYIVFKDVPLEKLGNRIPQVSVELSSGATYPSAEMSGNAGSSITFAADYSTASFSTTTGVSLVDIASRTVLTNFDWVAVVAGTTAHYAFLSDGRLLSTNNTGDIQRAKSLLTGSEAIVSSIDKSNLGASFSVVDADGTEHWIFEASKFTDTPIIRNGVEYSSTAIFGENTAIDSLFADVDGVPWMLGRTYADQEILKFYNIETGEIITSSAIDSGGDRAYAFHYRGETTDHFVVAAGGKIHLVDRLTGVVGTETTPDYPSGLVANAFAAISPGAATFWVGFEEIASDTLASVRILDRRDWISTGDNHANTVYDPINHALILQESPIKWCFLDRVGVGGVTLETICTEVAVACGVEGYDFTDLDQTITGWSATRGQGSNMLEPLLDAYDSDIRPHEFSIEGIKRTGVSAGATLETEWFTGQPRYSVTIKQSAELPRAMMVDFADVDADQQVNTARADRPLDTTDARGEGKIDLSTLVLDATEARQLANRYFRRLWNERKGLSLSLTAQNLALEPGDVRTLTLDGETITARCVRMIAKADETIATDWKYDASTLAALDGSVGGDFLGRDESVVVIPMLSRGFVLDIPYLRDADDTTPPIMYFAAAPYATGTWPGASFYQLVDGDYTEEVASVPSSSIASWGTVAGVMAYANPNVWDRGTELTVTLSVGTLTGCTEAQADANPLLNLVAIGEPGRWELVQFTTATLTSGTTYTVSGFKRGRRGTEWAAELHAAGDVFLLLDTATDEAFGLSEVNTTLSFKPVTAGRTTAGAFAIDVDFVGASLKPYAPASLAAAKESNGDWTITWVRRTRVGGAWTGGSTIPLGETTEAYELDIGDGVTTVTKTGITSPTYTWTVATQTSDTGAEVMAGDLEVSAFQISATVDRGFAATLTA